MKMTKEEIIQSCAGYYLGLGYKALDAKKQKKNSKLLQGWLVHLQSIEHCNSSAFWTYCEAPGINN